MKKKDTKRKIIFSVIVLLGIVILAYLYISNKDQTFTIKSHITVSKLDGSKEITDPNDKKKIVSLFNSISKYKSDRNDGEMKLSNLIKFDNDEYYFDIYSDNSMLIIKYDKIFKSKKYYVTDKIFVSEFKKIFNKYMN